MRYLFITLLTVLLQSSAFAQVTYLSQDFSSFPPTGWTQSNISGTVGWEWDSSTEQIMHRDRQSSDEHRFISPSVDLSIATNAYLHFDGEVDDAFWLSGHWSGQGHGISTVEVTTDGGTTWTTIWNDRSENDGHYSINLNLSPWLGHSSVQIAFYYKGRQDHEWWLDNVVIDNQPIASFHHTIGWLGPGLNSYFLAFGSSQNGRVVLGFSLVGSGPTMTRFGILDLSMPIRHLATGLADNQCMSSLRFFLPSQASGITIYTQCIDLETSEISDPLTVTIP